MVFVRNVSRLASLTILVAAFLFGTYVNAAPRVEMSIVTDWATVAYFGSIEETRKAIDSAVAHAAYIYRDQLGVELIASHVEIPQGPAADVLAKHTHAKFLLDAVMEHRLQNGVHRTADVTALLTVRKLQLGSQSLSGYATMGPACSANASAIVSLRHGGLDGQTLAHEVAHTLGVGHDGESPCEHEEKNGWLMSATDFGAEHFSQCSIETIRHALETFRECFEEPSAGAPLQPPAPVLPSAARLPSEARASVESTPSSGGGGILDMLAVALLLACVALRHRKPAHVRVKCRS